MAHQHPPRFLKIVDDAKTRVRETNVEEVKKKMDGGGKDVYKRQRECSWIEHHSALTGTALRSPRLLGSEFWRSYARKAESVVRGAKAGVHSPGPECEFSVSMNG